MDDLISRQAAIDAVAKILSDREGGNATWWKPVAESVINVLPSAQPKAHWEVTDAYPHRVYCSNCYKTYLRNKEWIDELGVPMNYCPNCGADMREGNENEAIH